MKIRFTFLLLTLVTVFSIISCEKEQHGTKYITLNVNLVRGAGYQLDLSQYADDDEQTSILSQAKDYVISEIATDAVTGHYIYKYATSASPKASSTGNDTVVLKVSEPGGRCSKDQDETNITINFTLQ